VMTKETGGGGVGAEIRRRASQRGPVEGRPPQAKSATDTFPGSPTRSAKKRENHREKFGIPKRVANHLKSSKRRKEPIWVQKTGFNTQRKKTSGNKKKKAAHRGKKEKLDKR